MSYRIDYETIKSAYAALRAKPMREGFLKERRVTHERWTCPIGAMLCCIGSPLGIAETVGIPFDGWDPYLRGFISGFDGGGVPLSDGDDALAGMGDGQNMFSRLFKEYGIIPTYDQITDEDND